MMNKFLKISGLDAKKFLQGQLTCNLDTLLPEQSCLGAHCNPQGRIISLFTIFLHHDDYYLLMLDSMIPVAMAALKKYAVFYKVTLEVVSSTELEIPALAGMTNFSSEITNHIPRIYPETSGKFLPHELNLHELNAISFNKGCYTGQEIIARMHYRGKLKKHLYKTRVDLTTPPLPGSDVYYQDENAIQSGGIIVDSTPEIADNQKQHSHLVWLVCDEANAKNDHLFMEQNGRTFLHF